MTDDIPGEDKIKARDRMPATGTIGKGLLMVHTGRGKGKSTAAFGLALRAIGNGMRVGIVQFVRGGRITGERVVLEKFTDQVTIRTMGDGFTRETRDRARDTAAAKQAWEAAQELIEASRGPKPLYELLILDELNIMLRDGSLDVDEVVRVLNGRPPDLHVVVTGRDAPPALIEAADLVTEMAEVKHPFRAGVTAQKGIEF